MQDSVAPGTRVAGRYTIAAQISAGAMGAVYRARDDEDGSDVALKRLLDPEQAARFEIEARLLARLRHARIVRVRGPVIDGGEQWLAMDLVEGPDLARVLKERGSPGLPVDDVIVWACQACQALEYVHAQQVVHRDVKPANLILSADGVVLVDFGVARTLDGDDPGTRAIGTPRFMAPEVFVGEGVSPRSDVYGLAATVWALLVGRPPSYRDPTRLTEVCDGLTADAERTLRQALDLRPERRVASAPALAAALGTPLDHPGSGGEELSVSAEPGGGQARLQEAIVRTAAGVFEAAAVSIALVDRRTKELVYEAGWGSGADEIVGMRLPEGTGLAGAVATSGEGLAVPDCRADARFQRRIAEGSGYVPHTMLLAPMRRDGEVVGVLSILDRRDGGPYRPEDLVRADLFADLAVAALP